MKKTAFIFDDWQVGRIAAGTVGLGMDYGFGDNKAPDKKRAINLLQRCFDEGINLFDTAPAYGCSEEVVGEALGNYDCYIATKVNIPLDGEGKPLRGRLLRDKLSQSMAQSLKKLRRQHIDVMQIHNATADELKNGEMLEWMDKQRQKGWLRAIGVSVYGVDNALAALRYQQIRSLQIAVNVFDQRMLDEVIKRASGQNTAILIRSALLKGVLSSRAAYLPLQLEKLQRQALMLKDYWQCSWSELAQWAIRFCLSVERKAIVLLGINNEQELNDALVADSECEISDENMMELKKFALDDEVLIDPSRWESI